MSSCYFLLHTPAVNHYYTAQVLQEIMILYKLFNALLLLLAFCSPSTSFSAPISLTHRSVKATTYHVQNQEKHLNRDLSRKSSPNNDYQGYNDDAFGLIFLSGGILAKDADFSGTFLVLSALAATFTTAGKIKFDERIPAVVAFATLLIAPFESSLRLSGSLLTVTPPSLVEIGLCTVSALWAYLKWLRTTQ